MKVIKENGYIKIICNDFYLLYNYDANETFVTIFYHNISQKIYIPSACDTLIENDILLSFDFIKNDILINSEYIALKWKARSTLWEKVYVLTAFHDRIEYYYTLNGNGNIDTLHYFEGNDGKMESFSSLRNFNDGKKIEYKEVRSAETCGFNKVLCTEPNNYGKQEFNYYENLQISIHSDLDFCGGNFVFNPSLLCYVAYDSNSRDAIAFGLFPKQGEYLFSEYHYVGGETFGFQLNYWGLLEINGIFTTPTMIIFMANEKFKALDRYSSFIRADLCTSRYVYDWWKGPIVCGWGEQSYMGDLFRIRSALERGRDTAVYDMCTQPNYEYFVEVLEKKKIDYGILCIDAKWFIKGGTKQVDVGRWPDLRGFVDSLHKKDKKVIIWWGMWEHDALDSSLCITYDESLPMAKFNRKGRFKKFGNINNGDKVAVDPTIKDYQKILSNSIYQLFSDEPGCYNLDGIKIDHVAAAPGIYGLKFSPESKKIFGIELVKYFQQLIYDECKKIKKDCLVIGQSVNPYFSSCSDMVRLGDVYSATDSNLIEQMKFRTQIANFADPSWLIDTDNWPMPSLNALHEYIKVQPKLGVPSLYYFTAIDTTNELFTEETYSIIRNVWGKYQKGNGK